MNALSKQDQSQAVAKNGQANPLQQLRKDIGVNAKLYTALLKADDQELARFMAEVFQAITANPKLIDANRSSLLMAIGEAASMGLSVNPNLGEAYLIPRKGVVAFQVGYKGLVKLAHRSALIESIYTDVVYRGEHYVRRGGTDPKIEHIPDDTEGLRTGDSEDIVAAYAVAWIKGSSKPVFRALSKTDLVRTAQSSGDSRDKVPSKVWKDHPEAMCRKTAIIRLSSVLPRDDKLRSFHQVSERDGMLEGGKLPPELPELAQLRPMATEPDGLDAMMGPPPAIDETQFDEDEEQR